MWLSMLSLFFVFGLLASRIHLEEDLNKLMPSSKNADGTTKLAFANLRIKDKTFLLFEAAPQSEGRRPATPNQLAAVCDEFVDSLLARNAAVDSAQRPVSDVFYRLPEDLMLDGIDYLSEHLPAYIDTAIYASLDTLITLSHMQRQMQQNAQDLQGEFGSMFPELIEMDPLGLRTLLKEQMAPLIQATGGSYRTIDNHFFVPDTTVCVAFLTPEFSATNTGQGSRLFIILNKLIEDFSATHPEVNISYHGEPASGYYNSSTIKHDLTSSVAWSLLLVLVVLLICMRTWTTLPLLVVPVAFGTLFGLAVMQIFKGQFSLMALGIGAIVLGVAMSYVLHVITHYKYIGDGEQVLRDEVKPVLLGCITTIGSFVGLFFIKTDLLLDFGIFAALAIVGTTLFSLIWLPHLLELESNRLNRRAFALIDKINRIPLDRSRWLLLLIALVSTVCVGTYLVKGTQFDSDMNNLGYQASITTHSESLLRRKTITGDKSQYFASQGRTMEQAIENFALLSHKLDSLQALGLVKGYTHTDQILVPLAKQRERIEAWHRYWTPERLDRVAALIRQTAPAAGLLPEGFNAFFDYAGRESDFEPDALYDAGVIPPGFLSTLMEQTYNGDYLCFTSVRCAKDSLHTAESDYNRICTAIADEPNMLVLDTYYYTRDTLSALNTDFNILQWLSMAFVFMVLLVSFRFRLSYTLLGFAPILCSWLIVLGAMALFDIKFNLINIIISTFIFGIGVDYSIFVMNGLIAQHADDAPTARQMLAYHKTAIFFSAFILIVTVSSMLFAAHPAIKSVGFATLVGMFSAVILSYVVQPAVFRRFIAKQK
jgi:predicted exporter